MILPCHMRFFCPSIQLQRDQCSCNEPSRCWLITTPAEAGRLAAYRLHCLRSWLLILAVLAVLKEQRPMKASTLQYTVSSDVSHARLLCMLDSVWKEQWKALWLDRSVVIQKPNMRAQSSDIPRAWLVSHAFKTLRQINNSKCIITLYTCCTSSICTLTPATAAHVTTNSYQVETTRVQTRLTSSCSCPVLLAVGGARYCRLVCQAPC